MTRTAAQTAWRTSRPLAFAGMPVAGLESRPTSGPAAGSYEGTYRQPQDKHNLSADLRRVLT